MQKVLDLTPENVLEVFTDCLFHDDEDTSSYVRAECVQLVIGFHPDRIADQHDKIEHLIDQLTDDLTHGVSFLNLIYDRHGNQWTSEHRVIEQIVVLGLASKQLECQFPEEFWPEFPGGMPYYIRK